VGTYLDRTMNQTLYACENTNACFNSTEGYGGLSQTNFTYVSWYNATSGKHITCKAGWTLCTGCDFPYASNCSVTNINLKKAWAIWILPSTNMTFNRTAY